MTKIEWVQGADGAQGKTWNPLAGCSVLTPGCKRCYAMRLAKRLGAMGNPLYKGLTQDSSAGAVWTGEIRKAPQHTLLEPLRRKKPTTWFVNSMSDLFHEDVPDAWIDEIFAVMALSPQHTFQVLTKRAERMNAYMLERWQPAPARLIHLGGGQAVEIPSQTKGDDRRDRIAQTADGLIDDLGFIKQLRDTENDAHWTTEGNPICLQFVWPLPNVWLGVSAERQQEADERVPLLLQTPAAVRFISAEPLLGPIILHPLGCGTNALSSSTGPNLSWAIVGGESGHGHRDMDPAWAKSIIAQCIEADVPVFMKQMSGRAPIPADMQIRQFPAGRAL